MNTLENFSKHIESANNEKVLFMKSILVKEIKKLHDKIDSLTELQKEVIIRHQTICDHRWDTVCEYDDRYTYCRLCDALK